MALPEVLLDLNDLRFDLLAGKRSGDEPDALCRPRDSLAGGGELLDLAAHGFSGQKSQARKVESLAKEPALQSMEGSERGGVVHSVAGGCHSSRRLLGDRAALRRFERIEQRAGEPAI